MRDARQELGERGERIAEEWLVARGWRVLARRFRSGRRDIDLVVERISAEGRLIAFVEVKARASSAFGGPLGAVHWRKRREMTRAARAWMAGTQHVGDSFRFDVVGVVFGAATPEIVHIENAFQLG